MRAARDTGPVGRGRNPADGLRQDRRSAHRAFAGLGPLTLIQGVRPSYRWPETLIQSLRPPYRWPETEHVPPPPPR